MSPQPPVFSPEVQKVVETVQKLLNLAAKNPNENEAAAATAKAMKMLAAHNLDVATVERAAGGAGKRLQDEVEGGFYHFQRSLWNKVARLNFCLHWNQQYRTAIKDKQYRNDRWEVENEGKPLTYRAPGMVWRQRHVLVGRQVNVVTTRAMANYLLAAVERVTRERCERGRIPPQSSWAMSYREGATHRLCEAIERRRKVQVDKEEKALRQAADRASRAGVSLETALTVTAFEQAEKDANLDHVYGEGYTARKRVERAEEAARRSDAEAEYTRWAAAHPKEARAKEAEEKAAAEKAAARQASGSYKGDPGGFWAGYEDGKRIGLDQQVDDVRPVARIR